MMICLKVPKRHRREKQSYKYIVILVFFRFKSVGENKAKRESGKHTWTDVPKTCQTRPDEKKKERKKEEEEANE